MYLRCPSAKIVSKASDDLPLPDKPVNTTSLSRGIVTLTLFKLFSFAFLTIISFIFIFLFDLGEDFCGGRETF